MASDGELVDFLIINVGGADPEAVCSSLEHLEVAVSAALAAPQDLVDVKHLKVIGIWKPKPRDARQDSVLSRTRSESGTSESDTHLTAHDSTQELDEYVLQTEKEWVRGVKILKPLIGNLSNLKTLEWTAGLPFSKKLWSVISPNLQHLVLDITVCSPQEAESYKRQAHFRHSYLKPLCDFRKLETLRIQGMRESYQQIIWEAVFRNHSLHTLEMSMAQEPLIRNRDDREVWPRIQDSLMKTEGESTMASEYRGVDGSGHLHHKEGHGEYLDVVAIRKARIAASLVDHVDGAILPLRVLRLEGFVVDALPFARGFNHLERVDFLDNCFDAGFALPEELRERVRVTTTITVPEGGDAASAEAAGGSGSARSSKVFRQDEVQLITETVGELSLRRKSVPKDLYKLGEESAAKKGKDKKKRPSLASRKSDPSSSSGWL